MIRSTSLILATTVCCAFLTRISVLASPIAGALPTAIVPQGYGVDIHFTNAPDAEFAKLGELEFGLVRMDFRWADVEKQKGVYNFAAYDNLTDKLAKIGARPLYILCYGNSLYDNGVSPATEESREAFAKFAAAGAARYKGRGVMWEIWNEPNLDQFWKPKPDPDAYAQLAIATAKAIRAADPHAIVIAPATSGQMPIAFLKRVFSSGLLDDIDGVSVHPYRSSNPETAGPIYDMLRGLIALYTSPGHTPVPILCSEWGYSTFRKGISESQQAQYALREYLTGLAAGIPTSVYYDWKEDGDDPDDIEHHYGLVRPDLTAKPAFDAIAQFNAALKGYEFVHRLKGDNPDQWTLLFATGDQLATVTWNAVAKDGDSSGMPLVRLVRTSDADWQNLKWAASIRYYPHFAVAMPGSVANNLVEFANNDSHPIRVKLTVGDQSYPLGRASVVIHRCPYNAKSSGAEVDIPVRATWDGNPVVGLPDIRVLMASPVSADLGPRPNDLLVRIANSAKEAYAGSVSHVEDFGTGQPTHMPVTVPGSGETSVSVECQQGIPWMADITIADKTGIVCCHIGPYLIDPMTGFPRSVGNPNSIERVSHPNNVPQPPIPCPVVTADPGGPTPAAVRFDYTLGPGWRFEDVRPTGDAAVPAGATAMVVWVDGNDSGISLRARYTDETGQTFQPIMGPIDWTGWRAVNIDLTGKDIDHWGGANDGVVHGKLTLTALLLVDTGRRPAESVGSFQFAYPTYLIGANSK